MRSPKLQLQVVRAVIASAYPVALQLIPFFIGALIVLLLLLSDQGSELVRIGTEQQHSALLHIMLASLPAAYAFVTLLTGWLFNLYGSMRLTRSTYESIRYKNYAVFVFALVIPAIVLIFFPVSKIQIVVGASLLFFSFFLTNLVTHRIQEKRLAGLLRRSLEISLLLALIIGIFGLWLLASIPNIAAIIGTLGVTIAALSVWAAAITILFGLLPARFGWSTKYGVFALIILIAAITSKPNEIDFKSVTERALTLHEESGDRRNTWWAAAKLAEWSEDKRNWYQADQRHNRTAHISNWLVDLASRETTRTGPVGIYLVSAEGGGLRAAVWTASILARLHKKSNGMITQNTLAYSGVSGGSLGIGVFLSCLESLESNHRSGEVQQCTNTALNNDFLAHGVARVLITEPFKLIPVLGKYIKSRDRVFEENIESSVDLPAIENRLIGPMSSITTGNFQAQLQHQNTGAPKPDIPQYEREYPPMPPPIMPGAIVMFNATDAWTGTRIVFSNVTGIQQNRGGGFGAVERIDGVSLLAKDSAGVPVSFAIHASARFPLFSPPGIFKQYAIVDGGYRENTGVDELKVLVEEIRKIQQIAPYNPLNENDKRLRSLLDRLSINVIAITNQSYVSKSPSERKPVIYGDLPDKRSGGIEAVAPISAVLASREVRSSDSVLDMSNFVLQKAALGFDDCQYAPTRVPRGEMPTLKFMTPQGSKMYVKTCSFRPYQDLFHEVALADFVPDNLPVLGWVLAGSTFNSLANEYPEGAIKKLGDLTKPAWWEYFLNNVCKVDSDTHEPPSERTSRAFQYCPR